MDTQAQNYPPGAIPAWLPMLLGFTSIALLAVTLSSFNSHVVLHLTLFAVGIAIICATSPREDVPTLIGAYLSAYLIRVMAILVVQQLAPGGLMFLDDRGYDEQSRYLASGWSFSGLAYAASDLGTTHTGYPILLGSLYGLLGWSVVSAKFLNAFFGAITVPVAYCLAVEICGDRRIGRTVAWMMALFLYDAMWAGFLMKDSVLLFLFTTTVLFLVQFAKTHRIKMLLAGAGLLALIELFRFYSIAVIALAALAALILSAIQRRIQGPRGRMVAGAAALTIAVLVVWLLFVEYGETIGVVLRYAEAVEQFDTTGSTLLRVTPTLGFVLRFLKAVLVYQLGPFPWVFSGVDMGGILFYPGMYLIYALLPFFFIGFARLARQLDGPAAFVLAALLLHAGVEIFMYQSGERQRIMVDALFVTCAAVGCRARPGRGRFVAATYALLLVFAVVHIGGRAVL